MRKASTRESFVLAIQMIFLLAVGCAGRARNAAFHIKLGLQKLGWIKGTDCRGLSSSYDPQ